MVRDHFSEAFSHNRIAGRSIQYPTVRKDAVDPLKLLADLSLEELPRLLYRAAQKVTLLFLHSFLASRST